MHLNRKTVGSISPSAGVTVGCIADHPERVLQFGEGNFLRSFVDWMIDTMNRRGLFGGRWWSSNPSSGASWTSSTSRTACTP